ncbi:cytochrome C [Mesorhizobium sp. LCM 4577]|uniref:Chaperone protein HtpG n=1 Tax=Mesorhizobium plurifarium TaxID=69974 RepID=A0A090DEL6_MESPL|nr:MULTISPECIES: cytochrome c3 family protein [unclassified Mesorhizobium]OHV66785.1 cytochrome C [Mesorhizobium sp. LCM 4576]OHV69047.1 cytochrome C [Mesorhizobium sp. LCM 4577]BCM20979.1 menaquinone reductase, multiheme cytochrome c subunit [Mesorhizobium sp. J8]CDX11854.1 Chaperone protein HtpG [Mesorhizobium plurifarium]
MPQVFARSADGAVRFVLWGTLAASMAAATLGTAWLRSHFVTGVGEAMAQPVPFSHKHHVGELGIDCRYCHNGVETSASAGLPATEVCMTCHSQLYTNAAMLAPVRASLASGQPLRWHRVNSVPDYVYFNHSIHIAKGVACETCHGEVDDMPLMAKAQPLSMEWCLGCHRNPGPNLRPPGDVFLLHWKAPEDIDAIRKQLISALGIHPDTMTDCYVCHR